jgi:hypothetical protein
MERVEAIMVLENSSRILVFRDLCFTLLSPNVTELEITDGYMIERVNILL